MAVKRSVPTSAHRNDYYIRTRRKYETSRAAVRDWRWRPGFNLSPGETESCRNSATRRRISFAFWRARLTLNGPCSPAFRERELLWRFDPARFVGDER